MYSHLNKISTIYMLTINALFYVNLLNHNKNILKTTVIRNIIIMRPL